MLIDRVMSRQWHQKLPNGKTSETLQTARALLNLQGTERRPETVTSDRAIIRSVRLTGNCCSVLWLNPSLSGGRTESTLYKLGSLDFVCCMLTTCKAYASFTCLRLAIAFSATTLPSAFEIITVNELFKIWECSIYWQSVSA